MTTSRKHLMTRRHVMMAVGGGAFAAGTLRPVKGRAASRNRGAVLLLADKGLPKRMMDRLYPTQDGDAVIELQQDLVWQWRQGLKEHVKAHPGTVVALVKWDKLVVFQGLAREERLKLASERLNRQVFRVTLAG